MTRIYLRCLCLLFFYSTFSFSQILFEQDIIYGGITGGGFSTGIGSGSGAFNIYVEPGSTIKKAYLMWGAPVGPMNSNHDIDYDIFFTINNNNYNTSDFNFKTTFQQTHYCDKVNIYVRDFSTEVITGNNIFNVTIPNQGSLQSTICESYGCIYILIIYENPSLQPTNYAIVLNDKLLNGKEEYSINNLNPINTSFPVGFAINTDRAGRGFQASPNEDIFVDSNYLGRIGGSDASNSSWPGAGVKGHFYYQNNQLFGLDDDIPNNFMDSTDGLSNVAIYLNNLTTDFNFELSNIDWPNVDPGNITLKYSYFITFISPCDTFSTSLTPDTTICSGETLQLQASGGIPTLNSTGYEWLAISDSSAIDDLSCSDCPNPMFSGDNSVTYTVRIWNTDSCSVVLPVRINVSKPQILDYYTGESKCGFSNGYIKSSDLPENLDAWYLVTPNNDTLDQPIGNTFVNLGAGEYSVFYIDTFGCKSEDTVVIVNDYINTIADFTVNPSKGAAPLSFQIENQSQNASAFEWFIDGVSNGSTPPNLFEFSGEYEIGLIAWDAQEYCADTTWRKIVVYDSLIAQIPNVFTANTDGVNDFFGITVNFPVEVQLTILNRWGNVVFDWNGKLEKGQNNLWNGKSKDGQKVSDGVYFYRIEFSQMEWIEKERKVSGYVHVYGE